MKIVFKRKNRKGSSSILVIMIIITLVLFGVLSVLSAYSSYKLSEKNVKFLQAGYDLEGEANRVRADLVRIMRESATYAIDKGRVGEDNRSLYYTKLQETFAHRDTSGMEDPVLHKDVRKNKLQWKATLSQETVSGKERFRMEMEFPYPEQVIVEPEDVSYVVTVWKKLPKEMEYENIMEFEDIQIEEPEDRNR